VAFVDGLEGLVADLDQQSAAGRIASDTDAAVAQRLHGALLALEDRALTDQRLWQWLTTVPFRRYTGARWVPDLATNPELLQQPAVQKRYLGGSSLNGTSRNALARLFWCARSLWSPAEGYRLSDIVLGNQDFYQALFERKLGLHAPLVAAAADRLRDSGEKERRDTLKNLNHVLTTVAVEYLDGDELVHLVESCRP